MRQTQSHVIDGIAYDITQLDAMTGLDVMAILARVLGPAAGAEDPGAALTKSLTGADLRSLCQTFAKVTMVQPSPNSPDARVPLAGILNDHFAGQYGRMMQWLKACVMCNYETFFADLGGILAGMPTEPKLPATSPAPSSGAS